MTDRPLAQQPLPDPPEGPPNIIMRAGMKIPPTRDMVLRGEITLRSTPRTTFGQMDARPSAQKTLPEPPEGPPNIIVRRGMKIPPTRDMVLRGEVKISVR